MPIEQTMADASFRIRSGAVPSISSIVVRAEAQDGTQGFGIVETVAPFFFGAEATMGIVRSVAPSIVGHDALAPRVPMRAFDLAMRTRNMHALPVRAAIECALYDLQARLLRIPLHALLGGALQSEMPTSVIVPLREPAELEPYVHAILGRGVRVLKVKADGRPDLDVARVAAVREAAGQDVAITVDANGAYEAKTAVRVINRMERHGILLFEQPVGRHDRDGLAAVTRSTSVAIEADESAGSLFEIRDLVRRRAVDSICLRMPRLGGLEAALFAARFCLEEGVKFRFGMCFMPSLGQAAIAQVAAVLPEVFIAHEVPEAHAYGEDPFGGAIVKNGMIQIDPSAPGLGLSPLPGRNDFTVLGTAA